MELTGASGRIRAAAAAVGAGSLLAQVVLLREMLAFSQGNELVVGLLLGIWLVLSAIFATAGARLSCRTHETAASGLRLLLGSSPILYLAALALTVFAHPDALGEAPSFGRVLAASVTALLPASAIGGMAFAWAVKASADRDQTGIYVAETAGAAAAGLLFHLLLGERLHEAFTLLLAGAVCACAAAFMQWPARWKSAWFPLSVFLVAAALAPVVARAVDRAHFPGQRVLSLRSSHYGQIAVLERGDQRVFAQDGVLLFTTEDQLAAEEIVHLPMLLHAQPRQVLFLGGGLGGGLAEVLKHGPHRVDYVEVDEDLLGLAAVYADEGTRTALVDSRVHVVAADGRALLRETDRLYDLILVPLPVPQNALAARYATREFFENAGRVLAPGGILALVTPGSETHLNQTSRRRHVALLTTLRATFEHVGLAPGAETIFWAAKQPVDAQATLLARRLSERRIPTVQVGPTWLFDRLLPMHLATYERALADVERTESRDFRPVVYLFGLLETLARVSPYSAKRGLGLLSDATIAETGAAVLVLAFLLVGLRRRSRPGFAAAAAGASGMSMQLVLLMAYQALHGHLYYALGLLLAASMAGMAIGAAIAGKLRRRRPPLLLALVAGASVTTAAAAILQAAHAVPRLTAVAVLPLLVLVGMTTGSVYPSAVRASAGEGAGTRIYAWDLFGSAGAAFLTSLVAIPLLGLVPVAIACAGLCWLATVANLASSPSPG